MFYYSLVLLLFQYVLHIGHHMWTYHVKIFYISDLMSIINNIRCEENNQNFKYLKSINMITLENVFTYFCYYH